MAKIVAIGDIHGRESWKKIIEKEKDADQIVFVGDYFDTHDAGISGMKQITNFKQILNFKKSAPRKVVLLMGNHDYHYLGVLGEQYSGYNDKYADQIAPLVREALRDAWMWHCYAVRGHLFSHAGVTISWSVAHGVDPKHIQASINKLPLEAFRYDRRDTSHTGESSFQSPIWVRPIGLVADAVKGFHQIVGHTQQSFLSYGDNIDFIDCLGTSGEYWKKEI